MRTSVKVLLALVVLLGVGLVVADRVGERVAEAAIVDRLGTQLGSDPSAQITGVPFITQAVRGRYRDVRLQATQLRRGPVTVSDLHVDLRGVRVPLADVVGGHVQQVPVDALTVDGLVTYDALATAAGGGVTLRREGDAVRAETGVPVVGQVSALATVTLEGGAVRVRPGNLELNGQPLPSRLQQLVGGALDLRIPVPALPYGAKLTGLQVEDRGVRLLASAQHVTLRAGG